MTGDKWNNSQNYIFTDQFGNFIDSEILVKDTLKIKLLSGVDSFNMYNLRRYAKYNLQMNGISFNDTQSYMSTNYSYYHLNRNYNSNNNNDWRDEDI